MTVTVKITALPIYVAAPFRVKLKSQTFTTYGLIVRKDINFSVKEFDVLYMLYSNPGMAFTKQQIYEAVWHEKANGCVFWRSTRKMFVEKARVEVRNDK